MSSPSENPVGRKVKWPAVGGFIVGAVGVIAALAQTWSIFFPNSPASGDPTSPAAVASAAPSLGTPQNSPLPTAAATPVSGATYLADMKAEIGSDNLIKVPDGLPANVTHPIALRCPTNTIGRKMIEVSYERPSTADTFSATLYVQKPAPLNQIAQLTLFAADKDHKPGSAPDVQLDQVQARIDHPATMSTRLGGGYYVRLRIECERPDTVVVLADALVAP